MCGNRLAAGQRSLRHATEMKRDELDLLLLHVEVVDDDADEQVEREERAEHDEEDEVEIHEHATFGHRL